VRALWIESWDGPLCRGERPDPGPGRGEVLIDVEACGVGLTVLNCIRGDLGSDPGDLPRIPGHELVGRITEVGEGVNPARVGQRVTAYFYLACGSCKRCLAGTESLCEQLAGFVGVHRMRSQPPFTSPGVLKSVRACALPLSLREGASASTWSRWLVCSAPT
jgi:D-arabinose 1-dehydrogenase-like Zn-dependent alcohol dehydrogenase